MIKGGLIALLTRFDNGIFNEGGGLWFRLHFYRENKQSRDKYNCNAQAHDQHCSGDVHGHNVLSIPFKRSQLQSQLQMHFKFEFELNPYECFPLFTQFKLVKHKKTPYSHSLDFSDIFRHIICPIWS